MPNQHVVTAADEIAQPQLVRPHLVVLGAGTSRAAFPQGERYGRQLPLMADFAEIVPVADILQKGGIDWRGKTFEEVYSLLSENQDYCTARSELESAVQCCPIIS
jgi:hypothetical protein